MKLELIIVMLLKFCHIVQGKKQVLTAEWYDFCQLNFCNGDGFFNMLYLGSSVPSSKICLWDLIIVELYGEEKQPPTSCCLTDLVVSDGCMSVPAYFSQRKVS